MKTTDQMTVAELRSFLAERNLPTTGTKPELMLGEDDDLVRAAVIRIDTAAV